MSSGRARPFFSRAYRARMVVTYRGCRWEIDAVEFWQFDQKLTLRALDGDDEGKRREVWAAAVTFTDEVTPLEGEAPPATGGHEL